MWLFVWLACHHAPNLDTVQAVPDCTYIQESTGTLSQYMDSIRMGVAEQKTGVYVLEEGLEALLVRGWLAAQAERTIDVQYFIFSADNVGLLSIEALVAAAERGVKVRLMVDDVLAHGDEEILRDIHQHPNIEVKVYNPNINIGKHIGEKSKNLVTQFDAINQRMHHKTFIVDGTVTVTGGRNVGDEYFDLNNDYNFRDRDVLLVGGVTHSIQESFDLFWEDEHSVDILQLLNEVSLAEAQQTWTNLRYYACDPKHFLPEFRDRMALVPHRLNNAIRSHSFHWVDNVRFVSDAPWKNESDGLGGGSITTRELLDLLSRAERRIWIQSPYLILSEVGLTALQQAIDKGIEVKILTNSLAATDNYPAFAGYQKIRNTLLEMGVELYEMRPDAKDAQAMNGTGIPDKMDAEIGLHAKSMLIDDDISVIGTFNMDPRSANLNTECFVVVVDAAVADHMELYFAQDMNADNAWTASSKNERKASFMRRLMTLVSRLVPEELL